MKKVLEILLSIFSTLKKVWLAIAMDRVTMACTFILALLLLFSTVVSLIIPDHSSFTNTTCVSIGNQPPGFMVTMLRVTGNKPVAPQDFLSRLIFGNTSNDLYIPISSMHYEGTDIVVKEFSASGDSSFESRYNIADVVYPVNPLKEIIERNGGLFFEKTDGTSTEESISDIQAIISGQNVSVKKFTLGTDHMGRDVMSRLLYATRGTLWTAFAVTFISLVFGFVLGVSMGILKGKLRVFILWLIRSLTSMPAFLLIIAIMFAIGNGFWHVCLASGSVLCFQIAYVILSRISTNSEEKFVESASALGLTKRQIMQKYILHDIFKPMFASVMTIFCAAILVESGLNFLGIGFKEPLSSWGAIIRENYGYIIIPGYAYMTLLPGLAIIVVSITFAFLTKGFHSSIKEKHSRILV